MVQDKVRLTIDNHNKYNSAYTEPVMDSTREVTIKKLYDSAYDEYSQKNYDGALRLFYQAWLKLPKPQTEQPLSATILAGIGDTYYRMGKYEPAVEALRSALYCPKTKQRALILMRLGQSLFDLGLDLQANVYLSQAHHLGGELLFEAEDDKYRQTISDLVI